MVSIKPVLGVGTAKKTKGKLLNMVSSSEMTEKIVAKARSLGAPIAGVASVNALKESPSHQICQKIGITLDQPWQDAKDGVEPVEVAWPAEALSAVVIGVVHEKDEPEFDWWDGRGTPGNRVLMQINKELALWIENTFSARTWKKPYMIEKGGIFLKDAAVMAGLGSIGMNNMVITPEYGPRIRFRALLTDVNAKATGPLEFIPCQDCRQPCRKACPIKAFQKRVYSVEALDQPELPGINGTYDRVICNTKMEKDIEQAVSAVPADGEEHEQVFQAIDAFEHNDMSSRKNSENPGYCVKYCRECELVCPW